MKIATNENSSYDLFIFIEVLIVGCLSFSKCAETVDN